MRIALCISGFMRTFEHTFAQLKSNLLDVYPEMHIFIHTWNKIDYLSEMAPDLKRIETLYHPQKIITENILTLPTSPIMVQKNPEKLRNINNVLSMFYKINKCNQLKSDYENQHNFKYDCVIRFRADIDLKEKFIIDSKCLHQINIPKYGDFAGLNDQFAFSNSQSMDTYSDLYNRITYYLEKDNAGLCMKPELLLKQHIDDCKLQLNRPNIKYVLLKTVGEILDNEQREREFGYII